MKAPINLPELLRDAECCARLTDWEENFLDDLRGRLLFNKTLPISDKQEAVLRRIEAKVYAT